VQRWNWFLAADASGKWITTNGYAEVTLGATTLEASLRFSDDTEPYHLVSATVGPDGAVSAVVRSPSSGSVPFELHGQLFAGAQAEAGRCTTVLLTDGTTVLGLAYGPSSHECNL
jgi:hypothetical protein